MAIQAKIIKKGWMFPIVIVFMRVLFGVGWLLAGVTKISDKLWFKKPGEFLTTYLNSALEKPDVPVFYKHFIELVALEHVMALNYVIPIVQIIIGVFIVMGFFTIPSILTCLFMHINFILSGNMNFMSLVLYTSAFTLIIFRREVYLFSLDKLLNLAYFVTSKKDKLEKTIDPDKERLFSNT
ncbi:hypothetical protein FIU87_20990 [Bacillus sp. THAF10]|uniref:hypothetical protein n=1 Tax=Bacillus sp. THAF10 TaxID=2587848 RepID=UPI00126909C2|nr:hypothetical protein [Bacillus sp. THAF10]QFT91132.1 hypothetical protein FIU87_20990 [Bacillus sp. THAF10]